MHYLKRFRYTLIFLGLFFAWVLLRPDPAQQLYQLTGQTMGTSYQVQLWEFPDDIDSEVFAQEIDERLQRVDREQFSIYASESEISRFNEAQPGQWFPVSMEVASVIQTAQEISALSGGYFDITVAPLVQRWGFGSQAVTEGELVPYEGEIAILQRQVDYRQLEVRQSPPALRKRSALEIDLGGIAKGYGTDVVADYFDSLGMENYFIEVGGELRVRGLRHDGNSWVPAIERPVSGQRQVHAVLNSRGEAMALAGSGDYRNYFVADGQRFSHEIDPFTGRPVVDRLAAVYVITDTAKMADALTTAFMAMGLERGIALAEQEGIAAYFIYREEEEERFAEHVTDSFARYVEER